MTHFLLDYRLKVVGASGARDDVRTRLLQVRDGGRPARGLHERLNVASASPPGCPRVLRARGLGGALFLSGKVFFDSVDTLSWKNN